MAANLERLARQIREKGVTENQPDWIKSGEAIEQLSRALPLPDEVNIENMFPNDKTDKRVLSVRNMRLLNMTNAEIAEAINRPIGEIGLIASHLIRFGLIPAFKRGRGAPKPQRKPS